jgi:hypothetical protein
MKNQFPGYYLPTDEQFAAIWRECQFVLDANFLLNLYRYTPETREELIGILEQLGDRLWVPHQAALEYQRNRLVVIDRQASVYQEFQGKLRKAQESLRNDLQSLARHPFINVGALIKRLDRAFSSVRRDLARKGKEHPDLLQSDPIRERVTVLLQGRVGAPFDGKRLQEIYRTGRDRYAAQVPPGYTDAGKQDDRQYGDLILWFQVLDYARASKKPVVLVTDDRKDDWWWRFKGRTIGPRTELVAEVLSEAAVAFYMYQADPFMERARNYLNVQVKQEAIEEVRGVRRRDEDRAAASRVSATETEDIQRLLDAIGPGVELPEDIAGSLSASPSALDIDDLLRSASASGELARGHLLSEEAAAAIRASSPLSQMANAREIAAALRPHRPISEDIAAAIRSTAALSGSSPGARMVDALRMQHRASESLTAAIRSTAALARPLDIGAIARSLRPRESITDQLARVISLRPPESITDQLARVIGASAREPVGARGLVRALADMQGEHETSIEVLEGLKSLIRTEGRAQSAAKAPQEREETDEPVAERGDSEATSAVEDGESSSKETPPPPDGEVR